MRDGIHRKRDDVDGVVRALRGLFGDEMMSHRS
jgi:hypothetical protein